MKELLRGESTISLEAAVLKCPNAELLPSRSASFAILLIHSSCDNIIYNDVHVCFK
jgi:hypothetical protein